MDYISMPCIDFVNRLCGKDPVPGGGGASAMVGSIGMALGNMVGALTVGKKKYEAVEEDVVALMAKATQIQTELLVFVEKDAMAFEPLAKAYGMPTETEEERAKKKKVMESALKNAARIPLEIMRKSAEAIDLLAEFGEKGTRIAISDVGVGAQMCKAALLGASLNVFINTAAMEDREFAEEFDEEANRLIEKYSEKAEEIYNSVREELQNKK